MLAAVCSPVALAHHSFTATYLVDQQIVIKGSIVQMLFKNPHSFIHVMAPDSDGVMQRWAIEWSGAAALEQAKVTHQMIKPGDYVTVTGNPGRDPKDHRILLHTIVRRSDGYTWSGTFP